MFPAPRRRRDSDLPAPMAVRPLQCAGAFLFTEMPLGHADVLALVHPGTDLVYGAEGDDRDGQALLICRVDKPDVPKLITGLYVAADRVEELSP